MTKFTNFFSRKILVPSAVIFTAVYFLILCFANLTSDTQQAITLKNSAIIYLFAVLLSSCDLIFAHKKLSFALKVVCHFVLTLVSTVAVAALAGYDFTYRAYLMLIIFIFVYALISPLYILIGKKHKKKVSEEYVSIFKKD
ncbi:MAG: DUF3021 family protein [Ruminococcaceae bacterium]|nr:DUF3021 family protein [Oscillospiraceae bacterium]